MSKPEVVQRADIAEMCRRIKRTRARLEAAFAEAKLADATWEPHDWSAF